MSPEAAVLLPGDPAIFLDFFLFEGIRITKISYNDRDTFVIEALSGDQAFTTSDEKIFNKSLKKVNGDDPSRSEDIYGFTFGDLYEDIKNQISPTKPLTTKDFIGII